MLLSVFFFGIFICGIWGQDYTPEYCRMLLQRDCITFPNGDICGTDGVTYANKCYLGQAYCKDNNVHQKDIGACPASATTQAPATTSKPTAATTNVVTSGSGSVTTSGSGNFVHGSEVALDIFCLDINYFTCPTDGTRVCGSDGKYYNNMCEFDKARCYHRTIHANGVNCS